MGPGQYRVAGNLRGSMLQNAGTSCFKAPVRPELFDLIGEAPGPGEYNAKKKEGFGTYEVHKNAFSVKTKRFSPDDTISPGPGMYVRENSCNVNEAKKPHAGMQSVTNRKEIYQDPAMPGVGNYNMSEHLAIGFQKIQGGAPNNFLILTKNKNAYMHPVDAPQYPRLANTVITQSKFKYPTCPFQKDSLT